jgi:hypothetical protein
LIFGAMSAQAFAFAQSQIGVSHGERPRYLWTLPNNPNTATVGPDGNIYSVCQTGTRGVQRTDVRAGATPKTYLIANAGGFSPNGFNLCFFGQAPAAGLDPWTAIVVGTTGTRALRYSAACMQGLTHPERASPEVFTSIASGTGTTACFDAAGKLWVLAGSSILRYASPNGAAGAATLEITLTGANWPGSMQDIAINAAGDLLVSRYTANGADLRRLAAATIAGLSGSSNTAPTAIYTTTDLSGWGSIRFDAAGNLWGASYNTPRYVRFPVAQVTGASGAITADIILTGGGTFGNGGATGPTGLLMFPGTGPVR